LACCFECRERSAQTAAAPAGEPFSRLELAGVAIHFAPAHICLRKNQSIHFYGVCGIKLPNLLNQLIAFAAFH